MCIRDRNTLEARVMEAVVANANVEVPEVLVDREVDDMVEELTLSLIHI